MRVHPLKVELNIPLQFNYYVRTDPLPSTILHYSMLWVMFVLFYHNSKSAFGFVWLIKVGQVVVQGSFRSETELGKGIFGCGWDRLGFLPCAGTESELRFPPFVLI